MARCSLTTAASRPGDGGRRSATLLVAAAAAMDFLGEKSYLRRQSRYRHARPAVRVITVPWDHLADSKCGGWWWELGEIAGVSSPDWGSACQLSHVFWGAANTPSFPPTRPTRPTRHPFIRHTHKRTHTYDQAGPPTGVHHVMWHGFRDLLLLKIN